MTEINYDQVSEKVSEEKYYLKNEINDFKKMAKRIGTFIGAAEKNPFLMKLWSEKFVQLISEKRFIPGGRILANAGTYFEDLSFDQRLFLKEMIDNYDKSELRCGQMLNCYVIPIEDSKHGPASIYQSLEDAADITAMEGGVGENFSNLRPEGFMIRGNPKYRASGPVSFLKLYNASSVELKQGGGRRGANMAVLNVDHPDIMKFINCKRVEGTIENFNISVGITDDFMEAVVDDKDFNLMWDGKIIQTVKARTIFNEICSGIYNDGGGGEPGFLFLDTAMKTWPFPHEKPQTTNPCVTADTWIMTDKGPRQVRDLIGKKFNAKVNDGIYRSVSDGFWKTGNKEVFLLETHEGHTLEVTKDHEIFVSENQKVPAGELEDNQVILLDSTVKNIQWDGEGNFNEGYLMGFLVGDGTFGGSVDKKKPVLSVWFPEGEKDVSRGVHSVMDFIYDAMDTMEHRSDWHGWNKVPGVNEYRISHNSLLGLSDKFGIMPKEKNIGEKIHKASSSFQKGFLSGFFDADGGVQDAHNLNVRLTQNNLERLKQVQMMLQRFGIVSKIYNDRKKSGSSYGGSDDFNLLTHELIISKENVVRFSNIIGFIDVDKQERLETNIEKFVRGPYKELFTARFKSLTSIGKKDVYDVTIATKHRFNANGLIISNCGEQFLGNYEACDLGAMNLFWYVTEDGYFDDDKFKEDIKTAIRFLDNVLDLNNYPLKYRDDICEKISMNHRRIGLGIMGLADTLVALGLGYGSEEANIFIEDKMRLFDQVAHDASVELGKEKGLFLSHDEALPKFSNRRNCCVTTIAPTGTTSMIADVWGGCEPWFGIVTKKKTTDGSNNVYYMVPKAFRLLCKKHGFDLTDSVLEKIYENKGSVQGLDFIPKEIRESAITAMDITWREHVSIQCTLQKYIENSISKTINLPRKSSIEDVKDAIFALWRGGAKGGTIYRDGTRNLQIMNVGGSENKPQVEKQDKLPVRPDVLSGKTHKVVTNLTHKPENIYITINENDNGHPVELFVHNTDDNNITTFIEFLIHNQVKPDIAQMIAGKISQMSKENISVTTRLVSLCLRHDLPIESIIKQLRRINQHDLYNLHKKISKLLAGYISNTNTVIDSCNNIVDGKICGGRLMFQESCLICDTCFVSKCD